MRRLLLTLPLIGLAFAPCIAGEASPKAHPPAEHRARGGDWNSYIGVLIESAPEVLRKQLPGVLPEGQGLLVHQVLAGSPAEAAGLKPYDILMSCGDERLTTPESLIGLMRARKPGTEVAIGYIRGGRPGSCRLILGEDDAARQPGFGRHVFRFGPDGTFRRALRDYSVSDDESAWDSFDAIRLSREKGDTWRAEIEYRGQGGGGRHHDFYGTREQIARDIKAMKDLPGSEREHLLRTLNIDQPVFEFHFSPANIEEPSGDKPTAK